MPLAPLPLLESTFHASTSISAALIKSFRLTVLARISKECPFVGLALRLFLVSYDYPLLISYSFMSQLISRRVWHIVISTESHHIFSQPR